jgi:hypothetical protein
MYYFTRLLHIVDGFILPMGMRVWVVRTHTRTRLPDGYMMLPIYVPVGRNIIPYLSPYRGKTRQVLRFRVPIAISSRVAGYDCSFWDAWLLLRVVCACLSLPGYSPSLPRPSLSLVLRAS